jgi:hypothetical protein
MKSICTNEKKEWLMKIGAKLSHWLIHKRHAFTWFSTNQNPPCNILCKWQDVLHQSSISFEN